MPASCPSTSSSSYSRSCNDQHHTHMQQPHDAAAPEPPPPQPLAPRLPKRVAATAFYDISSLKRARAADSSSRQPQGAPRQQQQFNPAHAPFKAGFKTQAAAFEFLDKQACAPILRTFAVETAATGQREFIVTSAQLFWQQYTQLPPKQRHHYEIIRQAGTVNLYFDLEFCPEANPGANGPHLVELLVSGVRELLQELYGVLLQPQHVLELDSSTPSKFSRHLIINLPGLAFADGCHAGRFARCVLLRLLALGMHSSHHAHLLVHNSEGGLTSFVDMGVYTRNRAFRLYLSSKFGKSAVLRLTHRFGGCTRCPKAAFLDSLVSVLPAPATPPATAAAAFRSSHAATAAGGSGTWSASGCSSARSSRLSLLYMEEDGQRELLSLPPDWQQLGMLQLRPLEHPKPGQTAAAPTAAAAVPQLQLSGVAPAADGWSASAGVITGVSGCSQPCFGPSPFPALDAFISSVCCMGGVQGEVRSWLVQAGSCCVVYNIKGNRWCGNVGRAHKSNGIYYCVDLYAGVYYQKCYDPECRQYRSNYMPLPTDVWQAYKHLVTHPAEQQQGGAPGAVAAAEDEECLQLLLHYEQRHPQGIHPQQQQTGWWQQQQQQLEGAACPTAAPAHHQVRSPPAGTAAAQDDAGVQDEDEWCLQLLQDVEQGHLAAQQRPLAT